MTRSEKIGRLIVILTAVLWTTNAAAAWLLCTATFPSGLVWVLFAAMLAADTAAARLMWFYKGVREYLYVRQNG